MTSIPNLITVAQFRRLPKGGECAYELHHGEVVAVPRPTKRYWAMQRWLVELLGTRLPTFRVGMEFPFRPFAEFELRAADVAAISKASFDATDLDDNLQGAPDLVIRLKSPSHTERSLQEFAAICL